MGMLTDDDVIRRYPELATLRSLVRAGWWFFPIHTEDGVIAEHHGFRHWPGGWIDGIRIWSPTDVLGIRTAPTQTPTVVWQRTGTLTEVVTGLLALPAPDDRLTSRLRGGEPRSASGHQKIVLDALDART